MMVQSLLLAVVYLDDFKTISCWGCAQSSRHNIMYMECSAIGYIQTRERLSMRRLRQETWTTVVSTMQSSSTVVRASRVDSWSSDICLKPICHLKVKSEF